MMFMLAFILLMAGMPWFIRYMKQLQIGEMVREEGPQTHQKKTGTPTMGGILFIIVSLVCVVCAYFFKKLPLWQDSHWIIYMMLAFGLVGLVDDYRKTIRKTPYGLKARENLLIQVLMSTPFLWILGRTYHSALPLIIFIVFELVVILSVTNSVNLTDGLDGLLAGVSIPIFGFYFFYGQIYGHPAVAQFALIFAGALLAFLFFNTWPAKIFMGNVGSFAIGGVIAAMAIITRTEWLLLLLGAIFVAEASSVILQVAYFKYSRRKTGEGRRIFRMAPIHHHFELLAYPEPQIVVRFWIAQMFLTAAAWWVANIYF